ncbi:GNAT family N-acetyltransferase [Aliihoeflea sp. PC F10.4]
MKAASINFRFVVPDDADFIVSLRTDATKNAHLSATAPDVEAQRDWLKSYKERETAKMEFYFIIETLTGEPCGVVRLYDFRSNSFCWGSWILADNAPRKAAIESALLVYEFGFGELGFEQSHFDVRLDNEKALSFHDRFGAKRTYADEVDQYFVYFKSDYERARPGYLNFLDRQ